MDDLRKLRIRIIYDFAKAANWCEYTKPPIRGFVFASLFAVLGIIALPYGRGEEIKIRGG